MKKKKERRQTLTVLIDADQVLNNLDVVWLELANERFGTNVTLNDVTTWDIASLFHKDQKDEFYNILNDPELYRRMQPPEGARYYLDRLIQDGHRVYILTAHAVDSLPMLQTWLLTHYPMLKKDMFIHCEDKLAIPGHVRIDDNPVHLKDKDSLNLLFDYPYNREKDTSRRIRVKTWQEVYQIIDNHSRLQWYKDRMGVMVLLMAIGLLVAGTMIVGYKLFHIPESPMVITHPTHMMPDAFV